MCITSRWVTLFLPVSSSPVLRIRSELRPRKPNNSSNRGRRIGQRGLERSGARAPVRCGSYGLDGCPCPPGAGTRGTARAEWSSSTLAAAMREIQGDDFSEDVVFDVLDRALETRFIEERRDTRGDVAIPSVTLSSVKPFTNDCPRYGGRECI